MVNLAVNLCDNGFRKQLPNGLIVRQSNQSLSLDGLRCLFGGLFLWP